MDSPLKAALTGLELLVARAQLWQTTAAKHVSLDPQLRAITALAGRWRRLELASWRRLLSRTIDAYAAGAPLAFTRLYLASPDTRGRSLPGFALLCSMLPTGSTVYPPCRTGNKVAMGAAHRLCDS